MCLNILTCNPWAWVGGDYHQMCVPCVSTPERQWSWYVLTLVSVCALQLTAAAFCLYSIAALVIRSPPQQIRKASIFAGCRSTTQQLCTEQSERDRKSDTDTTLKCLVNSRQKHISQNFINNPSLCAEQGLKSTDQRFSEAAVALDSVISVNSRSLATPALQLCCAVKRSLKAAGRCWWTEGHGVNMQQSHSGAHTRPVESWG